MKILVFGGQGMAGHMIRSYINQATSNEVIYTVRRTLDRSDAIAVDVTDENKVSSLLKELKPDIVINAVGILNEQAHTQLKEAIYVNSFFPHLLAEYGQRLEFRLIHISTDCVFSGKEGNYTEASIADGVTSYAKTKYLGEVIDDRNLTIRTSIVGPELKMNGIGLFHWFLLQSGSIKGYSKVYWNGVTTLELAKAIAWCLDRNISGIAHLCAPKKISKYVLLRLFNDKFRTQGEVDIQPYDGYVNDKSLVNTRKDFTYPICDYKVMIDELKIWIQKQGGVYPYA